MEDCEYIENCEHMENFPFYSISYFENTRGCWNLIKIRNSGAISWSLKNKQYQTLDAVDLFMPIFLQDLDRHNLLINSITKISDTHCRISKCYM